MNLLDTYRTNKASSSIINELYKHNFSMTDNFVKNIVIDLFKKSILENVKTNSKKCECLVCYNKKKLKYKIPCCDKQYICLDCLSKIYNIRDYNCMFCRKKLFTIEMFKIFTEVKKHWLFKANNICYYLHSFKIICDVKEIKKINNYNFEININGSIVQFYHDDQRNVYWFKDGQFLLLS